MYKTYQKRSRVGLTFRHFGRSGWSLFAAMGREVRIGVLGAATLLTAAPALGQSRRDVSQTAATAADTLTIGEAEVTTSRAPLAADVAARQVTTLSRDDIAAAGVTSVNDVLKLAAGVDVRQRGSFGMQTDISIDGGTFDQITLLVNGIPINNPQTGHNAADFPVNLSDIERIEVLEGAASRVFGTQAFSGAINIVTRGAMSDSRFRHAASQLGLSAGSYGTVVGEGRTAWASRHFTTSLSGSMRRSDGAVSNSDFRGGKAFWQGRYDDEQVRLDLQMGASLNDFGSNTFYSAAYPDQWEATRRYLISARAETKGRIHIAPTLSWMRNVDHFQLIRDVHRAENVHRGDVYTAGLNMWTQWALGRTAVGAELRQEGIYSSNLGKPMDATEYFRVHGQDSIYYTHKDSRTNVSYFLEHTVLLRQWTLSAGVMAQHNTSTGRRYRFYPGVDVSYRPSTAWRLFASWNKSLRLPTFTDLYYKSPTQEGNIGLKAEENSAFRMGADFTTGALTMQAKAFYNHGTNMIDWVMYSADDIYHATNFRLDNMGFGLDAALDFDRLLGTRQPLRRLSVAYEYIYQDRKSGEDYYKSNYALEYLKHKFVVSLQHRLFSRLSADWRFRLQHREGNYLVYEDGKSTGALHPYGTHGILDVKLSWTASRYSLFVDMQNITCTRYYDLGNVAQPRFFLLAGATVSF